MLHFYAGIGLSFGLKNSANRGNGGFNIAKHREFHGYCFITFKKNHKSNDQGQSFSQLDNIGEHREF